MHRDLAITFPAHVTDALVGELENMEGVVALSVHRGESVKPPGDLISAQVLNTAVDAVLERVERYRGHGHVSIATSELSSLIDTKGSTAIRRDVDEATWEDAETAMRHHTRPTINFFLTTSLGGVVAACGLLVSVPATEATALVAAAIIAPVFEPLARVPMAAVMRRADVLLEAAGSLLLSLLTLIGATIVTMLVLRGTVPHAVSDFDHSPLAHEIEHPSTLALIISACGAITGVVMVSAGRFAVLAGPVVALQLLPAVATLGMALEVGDGDRALRALGRLGIDIAMVLAAGLLIFAFKQARAHGHRRTLR